MYLGKSCQVEEQQFGMLRRLQRVSGLIRNCQRVAGSQPLTIQFDSTGNDVQESAPMSFKTMFERVTTFETARIQVNVLMNSQRTAATVP